jgi:hypothetical protein
MADHSGSIMLINFSKDGKELITGSYENEILLYYEIDNSYKK